MTGPGAPAGGPARTPVDEVVAARIARLGPLGFAEVMDLALYHPDHGFYAAGEAGRQGDFLTSPEVGPLFGAVVANALDAWWDDAGRPDPFVVVEAGAGAAMLARTVLLAAPACAPALTYVLVERADRLRARHGEHLELTAPALAFPPGTEDDDADADAGIEAVVGNGPRVVSLGSLPAFACAHVVFANELLDNLPVDLLEATGPPGPDRSWAEVRVALDAEDERLVELLVPTSAGRADRATRLAPDAPVGGRIPLADAACDWLRAALATTVAGGRVVVVDYADVTPSLAQRPVAEWLRTYRRHERGDRPLQALGTQDITAEVATDQLAAVAAPAEEESQAQFLERFGIEQLVADGRRIWHERAAIGDIEAVRARSRVREADALLDPAGLGAFAVVTWRVG